VQERWGDGRRGVVEQRRLHLAYMLDRRWRAGGTGDEREEGTRGRRAAQNRRGWEEEESKDESIL
jgi:hypothetical protein